MNQLQIAFCAGVLGVAACASSEAKPPEHIELVDQGGAKATITAHGFTFSRGPDRELSFADGSLRLRERGYEMRLDRGGLSLERRCGDTPKCQARSIVIDLENDQIVLRDHADRTVKLAVNLLEMTNPAGGKLKAGIQQVLSHPTTSIELEGPVGEFASGPGVEQKNQSRTTVTLAAAHDYGIVQTRTTRQFPDESIAARLASERNGATVATSRFGEEKTMAVGYKRGPQPTR